MPNLAIYRKYRPSTLSDLLGQDIIAQILKEAARKDRLAHAYLLSGPRGTGKTTTARLITKIANCTTRHTDKNHKALGEPCNACLACESIDKGAALDVIEIDAASNRGIDEMRALKENVRIAPGVLQNKVFIIDEAHQLTKEAANALLKTLEEPPEYVTIILATTELEKIPATIASRAQKFQFKHVPLKLVTEKLKKIATEEKIQIDGDALELIASAGEGSFRDAESLLDQMASLTEGKITTEAVESTLGKIGFRKVTSLATLLLENKLDEALQALSEITDEGQNLVELTKDLILYMRKVAVLAKNPTMKSKFETELPADQIKTIESHRELYKNEHLELLKNIIKAYSQMRYSQFPQIPLEIAIIESLQS
ncbi:DNA polymerase III, subunit gamma and tau [bacterium]|nr:DNA polymerase III, subunit gamma and tau [bacterium]|tara:strand:+ start:2381 stop:3490 length:1110 start_codon:yes stop_codon:yes gene_type:complete